ncbi:hypothetical protein OB955_00030 [Halobacteria archaeon AArc-m2/3/4]|uniref:Tat (Twin-arginine translocation) pathway signal sequence n=1 Tax=Natronoglomus mannanivorans TaxID=2979990 RepID=A0ABT2Q865_9EURY|nr:hypothetical protein [Halobacteria archaeon AArc-m2/3/4]
MGYSRRQLLKSGAAAGSLYLLSTTNAAASTKSGNDLATPTEPEETLDEVIAEAHGELELGPDRRYWPFEFSHAGSNIRVEYEVRTDADIDPPDVLVLDDMWFNDYKGQAQSYPLKTGPIIDKTSYEPGSIKLEKRDHGVEINPPSISVPSGVNFENIHPFRIYRRLQSEAGWNESLVDAYGLECLSASSPTRESAVIKPGDYTVVFDWTDNVWTSPDSESITADVTIRAMRQPEDEINAVATNAVSTVYTQIGDQPESLSDVVENLAAEICHQVADELGGVSIATMNERAPEAGVISAATNTILTILSQTLGYAPSFTNELTARTSAWTRWSMSVLPVASSLEQLIDDACAVAQAQSPALTEEIEDMLMSLGIFIAELVAVKFGLAGRVAGFVTKAAHKYLLGTVSRMLGWNTYLVLLRELYTATRGGIAKARQEIENWTRNIGEEYGYEDRARDDRDLVQESEVESVATISEWLLEQLDWDLGWLSLSPECHT